MIRGVLLDQAVVGRIDEMAVDLRNVAGLAKAHPQFMIEIVLEV